MADTLKTRTPILRAFDPRDRAVSLIEVHDHSTTECTLGTLEAEHRLLRKDPDGYWRRDCRYDWSSHKRTCCCSWCGGQGEQRDFRRRERHETKAALRAAKFDNI